jgi:hypothetical protein
VTVDSQLIPPTNPIVFMMYTLGTKPTPVPSRAAIHLDAKRNIPLCAAK